MDNTFMELLGHIRNGVVVFDGNPTLPEGAVVNVTIPTILSKSPAAKRVVFPLVDSEHPGTLNLTNQQIREIFDEEDFSPRH
jgi:hypothetical protein